MITPELAASSVSGKACTVHMCAHMHWLCRMMVSLSHQLHLCLAQYRHRLIRRALHLASYHSTQQME